jgi:hypothetical protein
MVSPNVKLGDAASSSVCCSNSQRLRRRGLAQVDIEGRLYAALGGKPCCAEINFSRGCLKSSASRDRT